MRTVYDIKLEQGVFGDLLDKRKEQESSGKTISALEIKETDISNTDMTGRDLSGINFTGSNFNNSNFNGATLQGSHLSGCDFTNANLDDTNLTQTNLSNSTLVSASFINADLTKANLNGADLENADFTKAVFSAVTINHLTNLYTVSSRLKMKKLSVKGIKLGINGFSSKDKGINCAAINSFELSVDSMIGQNNDAIIESLKRARRYYGYSLSVAIIALLMWFLTLSKISIPNSGISITVEKFILLGPIISIIMLILVSRFLKDAYLGYQYIKDRDIAISVANFPWIMTRYAEGLKNDKWSSLSLRIFYSFHVFLFFLLFEMSINLFWYHWIPSLVLIAFSIRLFLQFRKFQVPILFN